MRTLLWLGAATLALTAPALAEQPPCNCPMNCPMNGSMNHPMGGPGMRDGGWMNGPYARIYDPKTVETIRGEVLSIERTAPMNGMSEGVHAIVKTDKGNLAVHLGPAWYLDHQETAIAVGDRVEVKGSRVTVGDKPALIAAEVKKGTATLRLRDDKGLPVWRGWR